jgi:hypothetical protein
MHHHVVEARCGRNRRVMPMSSPATDGRILLSLMEHPSPSCRYPPGSRRLRMRNPDLLECEHAISRGAPGAASSDLHLIEHRWVAVAIVDRGVVTGRRHGGSRAVGKQRTSDATRLCSTTYRTPTGPIQNETSPTTMEQRLRQPARSARRPRGLLDGMRCHRGVTLGRFEVQGAWQRHARRVRRL